MTVDAFLLVLAGFACMALSMRKHSVQVRGSVATRRSGQAWRGGAAACLVLSLVSAMADEGTAVGIVAWTGLVTAGALTVALLLTYRPRAVFPLAVAAAISGLAFAAWSW
jgi:hypothetical protein